MSSQRGQTEQQTHQGRSVTCSGWVMAFALPFAARCMTVNASFICASSLAAVILDGNVAGFESASCLVGDQTGR
jgi:hypothetical protein